MAMGTFTLFDTVTLWEADGTGILQAANPFSMILDQSADALTSSSASLYSNIAHELTTGNGYTVGGVSLTGVSITRAGAVTTFTWLGPNPDWSASGGGIPAWRWMVIYVNATLNGHVNPLVGFCLGDGTNIDVPLTPSGTTISILPTGSGLITITHTP